MSRRSWKPEEIAVLTARFPQEASADLARDMGRPVHSVVSMARRLGLLKDPNYKMPPQRQKTAIFRGAVMTATEISKWIDDNRDYSLRRQTILTRMRDGLTGDDLAAPPYRGRRPKTYRSGTKIWPQGHCRVSVPGWGYRVDRGASDGA